MEITMANNSNASPVVFGFDFQVNATIFLVLDNIKNVKTVRMEGESEDIELTMNDGKIIMAQAKGIVKGSSDFSNVRKNLKKAIGTLSAAYKKQVSPDTNLSLPPYLASNVVWIVQPSLRR